MSNKIQIRKTKTRYIATYGPGQNFERVSAPVGVGETENEAIADLERQLPGTPVNLFCKI